MQSSHNGFCCVYQTHSHKQMESYAGQAEPVAVSLYFPIERAFCVVSLSFVGLCCCTEHMSQEDESDKNELEPLESVLQNHVLQCMCSVGFPSTMSVPISDSIQLQHPEVSQSFCKAAMMQWWYNSEYMSKCLVPLEWTLKPRAYFCNKTTRFQDYNLN